jgi:hypothetical protein
LDGIFVANEVVDEEEGNQSLAHPILDDDSTFRVYHLQFSNDTLFIGKDSWGNNRAIKANLLLFEMISSLKVNFHKSLLMRVIIAALSVSRTPYFYSSAT